VLFSIQIKPDVGQVDILVHVVSAPERWVARC
jgi:hypothetical protein